MQEAEVDLIIWSPGESLESSRLSSVSESKEFLMESSVSSDEPQHDLFKFTRTKSATIPRSPSMRRGNTQAIPRSQSLGKRVSPRRPEELRFSPSSARRDLSARTPSPVGRRYRPLSLAIPDSPKSEEYSSKNKRMRRTQSEKRVIKRQVVDEYGRKRTKEILEPASPVMLNEFKSKDDSAVIIHYPDQSNATSSEEVICNDEGRVIRRIIERITHVTRKTRIIRRIIIDEFGNERVTEEEVPLEEIETPAEEDDDDNMVVIEATDNAPAELPTVGLLRSASKQVRTAHFEWTAEDEARASITTSEKSSHTDELEKPELNAVTPDSDEAPEPAPEPTREVTRTAVRHDEVTVSHRTVIRKREKQAELLTSELYPGREGTVMQEVISEPVAIPIVESMPETIPEPQDVMQVETLPEIVSEIHANGAIIEYVDDVTVKVPQVTRTVVRQNSSPLTERRQVFHCFYC